MHAIHYIALFLRLELNGILEKINDKSTRGGVIFLVIFLSSNITMLVASCLVNQHERIAAYDRTSYSLILQKLTKQ